MDMLHAADYANMDMQQMQKTVDNSKKKDESVAAAMQYVYLLSSLTFHNTFQSSLLCVNDLCLFQMWEWS